MKQASLPDAGFEQVWDFIGFSLDTQAEILYKI